MYTQAMDNAILPYDPILDDNSFEQEFTFKRFDGQTGRAFRDMRAWSLTEVVQEEFSLGAIAVWDETGKLIAKQSKKAAVKCREKDERDFFACLTYEEVVANKASIPVTLL